MKQRRHSRTRVLHWPHVKGPGASCSHETASTPIGENLLGFLDLVLGPGEVELHFARPSRDNDFDRGQTAALHSQVELFIGFVYSMALEAIHGSASAARHPKAKTNVDGQILTAAK